MTNIGGTDDYMAPEQIKEIGKSYAIWTDVYGYGSLVADLFFNVKITQGKGLKELLDIQTEN
jgi:hypothetical protein